MLGKSILVPLTSSLYVQGTIADVDNYMVDVGTGYFVEKVRFFLDIRDLLVMKRHIFLLTGGDIDHGRFNQVFQ